MNFIDFHALHFNHRVLHGWENGRTNVVSHKKMFVTLIFFDFLRFFVNFRWFSSRFYECIMDRPMDEPMDIVEILGASKKKRKKLPFFLQTVTVQALTDGRPTNKKFACPTDD